MSKILWAGVALMLVGAFLLGSCGVAPVRETTQIGKWTDPETGCVYVHHQTGMGNTATDSLSIRFRRDGRADCPDA